jgi:DNA-directed RNA polymerase specialized sigma subunit
MSGNGYKPLPREAILALVRQAKRGDESAKAKLIEANRRLISKIAWHYRHAATSQTTEDLEQYGVIGRPALAAGAHQKWIIVKHASHK